VLSLKDYAETFALGPFVSVKRAQELENVGHTRFYELVKDGAYVLLKNGSRSEVTLDNCYRRYCERMSAATQPAAA